MSCRFIRSPAQKFRHFLVIDFEATCGEKKNPIPQEIIEFPVVKVNSQTLLVESRFHHFVRPEVNPQLTGFCSELTGIIQDMVDDQPHLAHVLTEQLIVGDDTTTNFALVTCGDWDLQWLLPNQCKYLGLKPNRIFNQWINVKKVYADVMGKFPFGMKSMLDGLKLDPIGKPHRGIDDCINIAAILCELIRKGARPDITSRLNIDTEDGKIAHR